MDRVVIVIVIASQKVKGLMRVIIKKPNEAPTITDLPAGLDAAQDVVGGLIQTIQLAEGLDLVINEENLSTGEPLNVIVAGEVQPIPVCGPVFFVGVDEEGDFVDLTDDQVALVATLWTTARRVPVPVLRLPDHVQADERINTPGGVA